MTTVNITEQSNLAKYLIITQQKDPSTLITTRLIITDNANNNIKLIDVQRGPEGPAGSQGQIGPPGKDGASFDILPIVSGGTNNSLFTNDKIIYYDGIKLSSTNYSIQDILDSNGSQAITGIIEGTGIGKNINGSTVTINTNLGDGLDVDSNNRIFVDDSIARKVELTVGNISGTLGIFKGGTNNTNYSLNRLVYFDGNKLASLPLDTGRIVTSGSTISIIAGSGLVGGGSLSIPTGSVIINIGKSDDIFVSENIIELSTTGSPGTYTKVITDIKGRVISGTSITRNDIINALGYTPWHANNDGAGSFLDADFLDGRDGTYYLNYANFSGTINTTALPNTTTPGSYSKVTVNSKGLVLNGEQVNYNDIVSALGYRPVSTSGDNIYGDLSVYGDVSLRDGDLKIEDNLPIFSHDNFGLLPNDPRGFSFVYGNSFRQTGILAYYPTDNQLKLVTHIFGTGSNDLGGGDSTTDLFNGEIDGGDADTIFLLGNLQGNQAIVLLQHIADTRYMRTTTDQIISGIKTFTRPIEVYDRIDIVRTSSYTGPPLSVGDNTQLNINLNSDLLDNEDGSFYRDAFNLTGILDYTDTVVTNLEGTVDYLPKFDSRTSEPSRTVSDSIIRQSGNFNIFIDDGSLSIGNNTVNDIKSLAVGTNNTIVSQNSMAVGINNFVDSNNSIAFNFGSQAKTSNSIAMGDHGTTWLPNQLACGAFEELSPINNSTRMGLGQHSITAIGFRGEAADYQNLTPILLIPTNKTALYNIDLIFSKFAGETAAAFSFHSGVIKNYEGNTTVLKEPIKTEIYNDSQIRDYFYSISAGEDTQNQVLSVRNAPLQNNSLVMQNLADVYRIKPDLSEISGYFFQTFDGLMLLKMNKPITSGIFTQLGNLSTMRIDCRDHGAVVGSKVTLSFTSGTQALPLKSGYLVITVLNNNQFIVDNPLFDGSYSNNSGHLQIVRKRTYDGSYSRTDADFPYYNCTYIQQPFSNSFRQIYIKADENITYAPGYDPYIEFQTAVNIFSGVLTSGSNIITQCNPVQVGKIVAGMRLSSDVVGFPELGEVAFSPTNDNIQILSAFTGSTTTGLIVYSGLLPPNRNYTKQLIDFSSFTAESYDTGPSGSYISGLARLYPTFGTGTIIIDLFDQDINIQSGELCFLNFLSTQLGITKPVSDNYVMIETDTSQMKVQSYHLLPDSGIANSGFIKATFDKDHGYLRYDTKPNILQQIPLSFGLPSIYSLIDFSEHPNPQNRKPKDSIYTISAVTGDYLLVDTFQTSLLKENSKPYVYDRFIKANYRTGSTFYFLSVDFVNSYFQIDDEIQCFFEGHAQYDQNFRILNIDYKNNQYHIVPSTGDIYSMCSSMVADNTLKGSGVLSMIGFCSGWVHSPINNIYFHSYGGRSESWGRDSEGKYVDVAQTGFFTICNNNTMCSSGTLCIKVSDTWPDFSGTNQIGNFSSIRPGDEFYFDFIDLSGFDLRGRFSVQDKLSPHVFTINVPRHPAYNDALCFIHERESGIVYLIDSTENIKTDKNPNYNNIFLNSIINVSNDSIYQYKLSSYNNFNNRWKHCISPYNTLQPKKYAETIRVTCDAFESAPTSSRLIVLTPNKMQIFLAYKINDDSYIDVLDGDNVNIPIGSNFKLRISVAEGAGRWSDSVNENAPRINIIGLTDYVIEETSSQDKAIFDNSTKQWISTINCENINKLINNHNIKIIVSDESGRDSMNFNLTTFEALAVSQIENTKEGYTTPGSQGTTWELLLDAYGGSLSTSIPPYINTSLDTSQGFPSNDTFYKSSVLNNKPENRWTVKVFGTAGTIAGTYHPIIGINDTQNTVYVTGTIVIKPSDTTNIKEYSISPRRLTSNILNKYNNIQNNNFIVAFPVEIGGVGINDPLFEWSNKSSLSILNPYIVYDQELKIYAYQATISGDLGYYNPQLKIRVTQPDLSGNDKEYIYETGIQVTIFDDMTVDIGSLPQPINFDINKPWSFNFYITQGSSAYRSDMPPKVYLGNTPNIGSYESTSEALEYRLSKVYDTANKYWKISVTGKRDFFGEFATSTGIYPIHIYAEDDSGDDLRILNAKINNVSYLKNINANKYATPNNAFEFNVDVEGGSVNSQPSISFFSKDAALSSIQFPRYHKYDSSMKIWESNFKSADLTNKWDAILMLDNDSLIVKAKGISSDKLYVAGRVNMVETDNLNSGLKPLGIMGINPPESPYEVEEGSSWNFTFKTTGGLEDPMYPPKIILLNLPTSCDGYDKTLPAEQCLAETPKWNSIEKSWQYKFSGSPLCSTNEFPNILVKAIDKRGNQPFGEATKTTKIVYKELGKMPGPSIGSPEDTSLFPNCQPYICPPFAYKAGNRLVCPRPTGISGIITSGTLPPGITMIDTKQGYWKAPYSDYLTSGTIFFQGNPTEFANGGRYPHEFKITVVDARGLFKSSIIEFNDASRAIESSPTDITIYFSTSGYQYTPRKTSKDPPGTKIIENISTKMLRPPANSASMECLSRLPHNNCLYSTGIYYIKDSNTIRITGPGTLETIVANNNREIKDNNKIYAEFSDYSYLNGEYIAQRDGNDSIIIPVNGHNLSLDHTAPIKLLKTHKNIIEKTVNDACYEGAPGCNIDSFTTKGIMGSGIFIEQDGIKGIMGKIRPSLVSRISNNKPYKLTSEHLENLSIDSLFDSSMNVSHINSVKFYNCYETGYLRFSGVILPPFSIDSVDPPPGVEDRTPRRFTSINNSNISVGMRSCYGTGNIQRTNNQNARQLGKVRCVVTDIISDRVIQSGDETTNEAGEGAFSISSLTFAQVTVGSIMKLSFDSEGGTFPTYERETLPSTTTGYYWVHKGFDNTSVFLQNDTFPPVIPIINEKLIFTTGININKDIFCIGGFIPINTSNSYVSPHITGYLQKLDNNIKITGTYEQQPQSGFINILLPQTNLSIGDAVKIKFNTDPGFSPLDTTITGLVIENKLNDIVRINDVPTRSNLASGTVELIDLLQITTTNNSKPYQIKLLHRSGALDYPYYNHTIDLVQFNSDSTTPKKSILTNIFPEPHQLSIISGTPNESYAAVNGFVFSGTLTNNSNIITNCSPSPINKLFPGMQLYSPTHQLPNSHVVNAIANDSIELSANYIGTTANNVMIYFEGYQLNNFYNNMIDTNGSGLCEIRYNLLKEDNSPVIAFNNIAKDIKDLGQSTFNITGIPDRVGLYNFAIITSENSGLLENAFYGEPGGSSLAIKKYLKDVDVMLIEPLKIIAATPYVSLSNDSWSYSFVVSGGFIPRSQDFVEIELNNKIHTFNRYQNVISDSSIVITLESQPIGLNYWSQQFDDPNGVIIRAYDSVSDTIHHIYKQV